MKVELTVNGKEITADVEDRRNRCLPPFGLAASAIEIFSRASHKAMERVKRWRMSKSASSDTGNG